MKREMFSKENTKKVHLPFGKENTIMTWITGVKLTMPCCRHVTYHNVFPFEELEWVWPACDGSSLTSLTWMIENPYGQGIKRQNFLCMVDLPTLISSFDMLTSSIHSEHNQLTFSKFRLRQVLGSLALNIKSSTMHRSPYPRGLLAPRIASGLERFMALLTKASLCPAYSIWFNANGNGPT